VSETEWAPQGIDVTNVSVARVYDYVLGGKDNFTVDREVGDQMIAAYPDARDAIVGNRRFLVRAVEYLAQSGIRRFLDIGSGLPTQDNVHQVAERQGADSRVLYVDNDPIVLAHGRALLATDSATIIRQDLRRPGELLAAPKVAELLDGQEPIALLLVAILHFLPDSDQPHNIVKTLVDALPSGSFLALSHATADTHEDASREAADAYQRGGQSLHLRSRTQVAEFFRGLEMVEPGLVWAEHWRPQPGDPARGSGFYTGVARKP
jgi:hypothetical protein